MLCLVLGNGYSLEGAGQTTWRRTYGGLGPDDCAAVALTSAQGFLLCGSTGSFGDGGDIYVVKTDDQGLLQWSIPFGGSGVQFGVACLEDPEGVVVAGTNAQGPEGGYDMCLARLSSSGDLLWQTHVGTPDWDLCHDMCAIDGGFILVGRSFGTGEPAGNAWVVRTDPSGDTLWTRSIGGQGLDEANGVFVDPEQNIIVVGTMDVGLETEDAFLAKYTSSGDLEWIERFGGDSADTGLGVVGSPTGGYVVVGATRSYASVPQVLLRKFDQQGGMVWQREYGTLGETRMQRIVSRDGGYAMAGFNTVFNAGGKDMFLILVDEDGGWVLGKNYGGTNDEVGTCVRALDDGGYIVGGQSENYGPGIEAMYVVRVGSDAETLDDTVYPTFDPVSVQEASKGEGGLAATPNPNGGDFGILGVMDPVTVDLFDAYGRQIDVDVIGHNGFRTYAPSGVYTAVVSRRNMGVQCIRIMIAR